MELFSRDNLSISVFSAMELKRRVAEKVIQLRKEKGFSQTDMAMKFNMSQVAYAKIESCKTDINLEKLFLFCEIFRITLTELMGLDQVISTSAHTVISELQAEIIVLKNDRSERTMLITFLKEKLHEFGFNLD